MKPRCLRCLVLNLVLGMLFGTGGLMAQQPAPSQPERKESQPAGPTTMDYSRSRSFPNVFEPYFPRFVPETSMANSERVHLLIREGKLHLSLADTIALALENNLDIAIARYTPAYAQTDVLRAKSGGATRGGFGAFQSTALFGGALGGGIGGGGGGGGGGAGGAFGGGGAVNTGSVGSFDPIAGFSFGWDHRATPLGITILQGGVPSVTTQTTSYSGFFGQRFLTGTSYVLALNGTRQSTTSLTSLFNPQVPSGMTIGLNQPLLRGFGYRANAQFIRIARNSLRFADSTFRQQVILAVTQISNLYWDLVSFRENVRVANQALALAQKTLSDNKRQVEIGTLAPIEVVRAESEVAARQQDLIVAQTNAQQQQEVLKTALSKHVDAELAAAEIIPTDALPEPKVDDAPPLEQALRLAAQNRPEIEQGDLNIRNQEITIQASRNSLLPELSAFATYAPQGLSGNALCGGSQFQPACPPGVTGFVPGGVSQSFTQTFQGRFPDYSYGLTLQFPIRNRSAQADVARALLEERQLRTQLQKTHNQVEQDVRNAEIALIQAKAQIEAAGKAVILAQQTLEAEQKKFQLGESTVFQVIQAQRDLATQEGNNVRARSTYAKALTQFAQATGTTLEKNRIELEEAKEGRVSRAPNIPGTPTTPETKGGGN